MHSFRSITATLLSSTIITCAINAQLEGINDGHFEIRDSTFLTIIDVVSGIETLAEGHDWIEGPLWIEDLQILIYNDIPRNTTYAWSDSEGVYEYLNPSGYTGDAEFKGAEPGANGMALDSNGRLMLCQHGDRRLALMMSYTDRPKSRFITLADKFEGMRFNSPNDLTVHSSGAVFFTDPPYGLPKQMNDPRKEIPYQGVYRLDTDMDVIVVSKSFTRPNGIALSHDEKTLYVANSDPNAAYWKSFQVEQDLSLTNESVFYDVTDEVGSYPGLPDGLKVDSKGVIYATGPGGIYVFTSGGEVLGRILTGQATSNCALDAKEEYLYITADMYLLRVKLQK